MIKRCIWLLDITQYTVNQLEIAYTIGYSAGVYKLHCLESGGSGYTPIARLLGSDQNGILYIGSSAQLRNRVAQLRKVLSAAVGQDDFTVHGAHPCGHKYKVTSIQAFLPYERLCVTVYPIDECCDPLFVAVRAHR